MTPQVEAKTTLSNVRLATWFIRLVTFGYLFAGIVSLIFGGAYDVNVGLLIFGSVGLTQPLLLPCAYSIRPSPNDRKTLIGLKFILYVWLFILSIAMATCLLLSLIAMFSTTIALLSDSEDFTILAYVVFAPCLVFTIENGYGSTGLTAGGAPDETSRILPPSNSVDVGNLEAGSDFYVGNDRDSLV